MVFLLERNVAVIGVDVDGFGTGIGLVVAFQQLAVEAFGFRKLQSFGVLQVGLFAVVIKLEICVGQTQNGIGIFQNNVNRLKIGRYL